MSNVSKFRRIKHGEPTKLKVLAEDLSSHARRPISLIFAVVAVVVVSFTTAYLA